MMAMAARRYRQRTARARRYTVYDVTVSGARCAGAPTAMLLARQGLRVLLVDRATFPSNLPHGHFIHMDGPSRLKRWGLLDRIVSAGCPLVQALTTDFDDSPLTGTELRVDGVALGYGPRRAVLDKVLVDAAVEAGAELREGFVVDDLIWDRERVAGICGRDRRGGATVTERARVTVGADGRHSLVARTVKAPPTRPRQRPPAGTSPTGAVSRRLSQGPVQGAGHLRCPPRRRAIVARPGRWPLRTTSARSRAGRVRTPPQRGHAARLPAEPRARAVHAVPGRGTRAARGDPGRSGGHEPVLPGQRGDDRARGVLQPGDHAPPHGEGVRFGP